MELRIGGKDGSLVLRAHPGGLPYTGCVEIGIGDEVAVRREVQQNGASGFSDLAGFFESLAVEWRGWPGERTWESLEGELALTATHDGHVHLRVDVRSSMERDWRVRCTLTLEPGEQLSAAARDARAFASQYSAG